MDLAIVEHTTFEYTVVECTTDVVERTASNYTGVAVEKTVVSVAQIVMVAAVEASTSISVLLPSCSTYPSSFLGASRIPDNPCLHDQKNNKKYDTNS